MDISTRILSDITVFMKYAKYQPQLNRRETWHELVTRNKGMHQKKYPQLTEEIEAAYKYVYDKKILPSMRSMQFAGRPIEVNPARIYNCAFLTGISGGSGNGQAIVNGTSNVAITTANGNVTIGINGTGKQAGGTTIVDCEQFWRRWQFWT